MDTRQLAAFCEVVERKSFSAAAERLGVTQPAVSLQIRSLEKRLGETLLDRSGRRVHTAVATAEIALAGACTALALTTPLFDPLPVALPLPALALLSLGLPVGKLLLAGSPSVAAWVAEGPRTPAHRPEPAAAGPRTRGATLAVIGLALVAVALSTPVPTVAPHAPATAGTGQR